MAKTCEVSKRLAKTVVGVALTSQLLTNGQMDEQTNGRTGYGTPISHLRANAGATIIYTPVYIVLLYKSGV